jgi:hypothetical protein
MRHIFFDKKLINERKNGKWKKEKRKRKGKRKHKYMRNQHEKRFGAVSSSGM